MSYGVRVWDGSGHLTLDSSDHLSRIVHSRTVAAGDEGSVTLTLPSADIALGVGFIGDTDHWEDGPHDVTLDTSTGKLSWSTGDFANGPTVIAVFAYG